ncbi:Alpha/Beta hydrolase protein [Neocallimastix lanati (nom. inval.)]|jgi:hypothetical protein|uniref:Alpha/beta-hydrolase n=1 Tax=Neocallimastix californiae TaxID=1754190 RepID=A0A1Y2ARV0_9FUNG|nr:Alpha/Beta hydrolase protein [Neocallimastix sp. JGI-2020a]ORY25308.1 hypothetical protein LY90DRAFT_706353 [Neocallimastix californiae]|eukprot:ORY25308.1 hypothetical protein LY90DRAFT_706353 [Neocallimastix californiae]
MSNHKLVIYIHGKGGDAKEAEHYKPLFKGYNVIGFDYEVQEPWKVKEKLLDFYNLYSKEYKSIIIIANSIGAFFTMNSLFDKKIDKALFISPIVNMENLIKNMMSIANVTENELCNKKEITTDFGETLSWEYLCYIRENPLIWNIPTYVLYGENDTFTSKDTMKEFIDKSGANLNVMKNGEHWFHTEEQMEYLDNWIKNIIMEF